MRALARVFVLGSTLLRATLAVTTNEAKSASKSAELRLLKLFEFGWHLGGDFGSRVGELSGNVVVSSSRNAMNLLQVAYAHAGDQFLHWLADNACKHGDSETRRVAQTFLGQRVYHVSVLPVERSVQLLFDGGWKLDGLAREKMLSTAVENMFDFYSVGVLCRMFVFRSSLTAAKNGDLELEGEIYRRMLNGMEKRLLKDLLEVGRNLPAAVKNLRDFYAPGEIPSDFAQYIEEFAINKEDNLLAWEMMKLAGEVGPDDNFDEFWKT